MNDFFLTCPRGLENVTYLDISKYLKEKPKLSNGGVSFRGSLKEMYYINLYSRTGMYVLKKIYSTKAQDYKKLYKCVFDFNWSKIIGTKNTFSIRSKVNSKYFINSNFTTLKIKDAIVDSIKKYSGSRPNIDRINPDRKLFVFIKDNKIQIYLDSSGRPLFMRGYRTKIHKAALNESLAAGLIMLSNWNQKNNFYDFMCGSGTIPIEAAMLAFNISPRILRDDYAFQKWEDFDESLWNEIKGESLDNINIDKKIYIFGSDLISKNIVLSEESSKLLNISNALKFQTMDFKNFKPTSDQGTIIINPPYGERIGEQFNLDSLYESIGDQFKKCCGGHDAYVFTGNLNLAKKIGLQTRKRMILKNGTIDCRLLYYPMIEGSFK